jgi:hypothetical protein
MIQAGKARGSSATTAIAVMKQQTLSVQPCFSVGRPAGCYNSIFLGQMEDDVNAKFKVQNFLHCFLYAFIHRPLRAVFFLPLPLGFI